MPRRLLVVPQIGEVVLSKRRGNRNIRLSINAAGQIRVGLPAWAPYEAGLLFVKRHRQWIKKQLLRQSPKEISDGSFIGKRHRLKVIKKPAKNGIADIRVSRHTIEVKTDLAIKSPLIRNKLLQACERALKEEAESLLPTRVKIISRRYNLPYKSIRIRKLTSRWGSCSSKKEISLSYFIMQLPWELIDYVILHELAHTRFNNHSRSFWTFMGEIVPNLSQLRREIKLHKAGVEPI